MTLKDITNLAAEIKSHASYYLAGYVTNGDVETYIKDDILFLGFPTINPKTMKSSKFDFFIDLSYSVEEGKKSLLEQVETLKAIIRNQNQD